MPTIVVKRSLAQLTPNTGLLVPTKRHLVMQCIVGVHPNGTRTQRIRHLDGIVQVLGVDGGGQSIIGLVANSDNLLLGLELGNGAHGTEDLLLHNTHLLGDIREDGRLDEVALVTFALTADLELGTCVLAGLDVAWKRISNTHWKKMPLYSPHNAVELYLRDQRALEGVLGKRVANNVLLRPLLKSLYKLVVDTLLHVDAGAGAAALAAVEEDAKVDPRDGVVNVSVLEDDVGRLSAELESDLLQVRASSGLQDRAADNRGASECNLVNIHVRREGGTSDLAEAGDNVDDTWRETGLLD